MTEKSIAVLLGLLLVAGAAVAAEDCGGCQQTKSRTCGNEVPGADPCEGLPEVKPTVVTLDSMWVATIAQTGPYEAMGNELGRLFAWLEKNGITMLGAPFGVYYDNPEKVAPESTRYEVGVQVMAHVEVEAESGVELKRWGGFTVAKALYVGPYEKVVPTYHALQAWVNSNEYFIAGPSIEWYQNSPMEVPPESLRTDIAFQVLPQP